MVATPILWGDFDIIGTWDSLIRLTNGNYLASRISDNSGSPLFETQLFDAVGNALSGQTTSLVNTQGNITALAGGGFALVSPDPIDDELDVLVFGSNGLLSATHVIDASSLGELASEQFPDLGQSNYDIAENDAGDLFITGRVLISGQPNIYGWTISPAGTISSAILVDNNGTIFFDANAEDPDLVSTVAIGDDGFASLIFERDASGLVLQGSLNIQISNADGSNDVTIELTDTGVFVPTQETGFAYIGNDTLVTHVENRIVFADTDGTLGAEIFAGTGSRRREVTALEDISGNLTGEFLISGVGADQLIIKRYDSTGTQIGATITIDNVSGLDYSIDTVQPGRFVVYYNDSVAGSQALVYSYIDTGQLDEVGNFIGLATSDVFTLDSSFDNLYFGNGNDIISENFTTDFDIVDLGLGNDTYISDGGIGLSQDGSIVEGGAGVDTFDLSAGLNNNIIIDFQADGVLTIGGALTSFTLSGFENFIGGNSEDDIRGDDADNILVGNEQADFLSGRNGDDLLNGGDGDDTLIGGGGVDDLIGEDGDDILVGGSGDDILRGFDGNDTFYQWNHSGSGAGFTDSINGGSGIDTLRLQVYDESGPQGISGTDYTYNLSTAKAEMTS